MKLVFPMKFSLRSIFCVVVLVAFLLIGAKRVLHVNNALNCVDSIGGDVWCRCRVCDGMSNKDVSISKSALVWRILTGESTDIWLCDFPGNDADREGLAKILAALSPKSIRFNFCDDESLNWVKHKFSRAMVQELPSAPASNLGIEAVTEIRDKVASSQDRFLLAMNSFEEIQKQDPQFWYRNNRYEVLIGYPADGDFSTGILQDKWSGRMFRFRR